MAKAAPAQAISHQNVRLGPGRHPRPGKTVCVMELASMLAGERFGDRPATVCPVIGAILRAYNDNVDDRRRQDLYRFAADAVDTRRDYHVQRRRADAALDWAVGRYQSRGGTLLSPPDPEGPRDEIGYYVVGALTARGVRAGRWSDEDHAAMIGLLEDLIELEREPALDALVAEAPTPLVGQLLEQPAQPLEYGAGDQQILLAELGHGGSETWLEARPALLHEAAPVIRERRQHDTPVAVGTLALDQSGGREPFQHFRHARRAQIGGVGQVAHRHLRLVAQAEQQAVLRIGEMARSVGLAPAQSAHRGHRALERSRDVLGGVALLALAYHVAKRI
jgi:hypothetical protein